MNGDHGGRMPGALLMMAAWLVAVPYVAGMLFDVLAQHMSPGVAFLAVMPLMLALARCGIASIARYADGG